LLIQRGPTAEAEEEEGAGLAEAVTVAEPVTAEAQATAEAQPTAMAKVTEPVLVSATATLTTLFQPVVLAPQLPDIKGRVTMGMA